MMMVPVRFGVKVAFGRPPFVYLLCNANFYIYNQKCRNLLNNALLCFFLEPEFHTYHIVHLL